MKMRAHADIVGQNFAQPTEQLCDLGRHANTDGIGKRDFHRAFCGHFLCDMDDHIRIDRTLERAAEGGGDRDLCLQPLGLGKADHLAIFPYAFLYRLALVLLAERIAGDDHATGFVDPALVAFAGCQAAQHAALVQTQADIGYIVAVGQSGDHRFGIGHLRHASGMDKAGDLDPLHAGIQHASDQTELVGRGNDFGFILKPVPRTDLQNCDLCATVRAHINCIQSCLCFV